ncbi:thioredoxin family protein [Tatumella terrea]|uniref:Thioredoxin family protein n=1 Tax=Tatumella terrea TaxID=419007 RepID=A0ABW1VUA4_9GAMM
MMMNFTAENPVYFLSQQQGFVLLDLWAPWCAPCQSLEPVLEQLSVDYSDELKIIKVNIDDYNKVPGELNVRSIPTLILFRNGSEVARKNGVAGKADFVTWLTRHGCQSNAGEPVYLYKSYDWLSFYHDQRVLGLFTRELLSLSDSDRASGEITAGDTKQGNLLSAIDDEKGYLSRVFGLPDVFLHFFSFLSFQETDDIHRLAGKIKAGKDYSLIPLQSIRHWLQEALFKRPGIKFSDQQQQLTAAWCQAIGQVIEGQPSAMSLWQDIASEATACMENSQPHGQVGYLLAFFISRNSPPLRVENKSQIDDFSRFFYAFYEYQYQLAAGWTDREIFEIRQERMDWIRNKLAADREAGVDIHGQAYSEALFTVWAERNEENSEFQKKETDIHQQVIGGHPSRSLKEYFITLL